ncbi:MAG: hypothetical protein M1832_000135 [Thelocarpon impressellum]|nr:MAG: hypothetical protein M1832_000135 [Thelocarpon impressellum]
MTPPTTPYGSTDALVHQPDPQPVFHSFLRAFYPFHPATTISSSTVTLPLNEGDLILVHSIHTNGWADGTLLTSGSRGWLPTNYCEAYNQQPMRNLLKALLNLWDLLRGDLNTTLECFGNQEFLRGIIAGVRCLLEKSGCLTRDCEIVKDHAGLRKTRKALLSDLSALVKTGKHLQAVALGVQPVEDIEELINEVTLKAFKIVTRGVKFLDVWERSLNVAQVVQAPHEPYHDAIDAIGVPPTPPAEKTTFGQAVSMDVQDTSRIGSPATNHAAAACGIELVRRSHIRPGEPLDPQTSRLSDANASSYPLPASRPATSQSMRLPSRPPSTQQPQQQAKRSSASHRVSYNANAATASPRIAANLASQRLGATHDAFLSHQGSFIGRLQLQSRTLSELLLTTQQSVTACRDLLAVVEAVCERDCQRSEPLQQAKDNMYARITDLVQATRDIFRSSSSQEESEGVLVPEDDKTLMLAATGCVKAAGECVAQTRFVLEKIGDFEFEAFGPGMFDSPHDRDDAPRLVEEQTRPPTPAAEATLQPKPSDDADRPRLEEPLASAPSCKRSSSSRTVVKSVAPLPVGSCADPAFTLSQPGEDEYSAAEISESSSTRGSASWANGFSLSSSLANSTILDRTRNSAASTMSRSSTRATTPDLPTSMTVIDSLTRVEPSVSGSQTDMSEDCEHAEAQMLEKTYAHELVYNKDGQITGGTLPALIERLTTHDSTPDSTFVSTFYLTFRLFTTPTGFAEALVERFKYVADSPHIADPVRLRVYNVFKGWIESHWRHECDRDALLVILPFANGELSRVLPAAGARLAQLGEKVSAVSGALVPRLVSSIGKANTSIAQYVSPDTAMPAPVITKGQLTALRNWKHGGNDPCILDFDPLELARQFTVKESKIFCSIMPEELLAMEWTKKSGSKAVNVRAMSTLSTDLTTLVADTILDSDDPKKRAAIIKHWIKIAKRSLELNNYDSLMAIVCSINSSHILRLKRTWDAVSQKTKARLDELQSIVEVTRNYAVLRQRLQNHVPPCLPFVGTYLTDLTFVDVGNQATRQLHSDLGHDDKAVINFDKHMKTAKIIGELQRFQIPYRLAVVPELQEWMDSQISRVKSSSQSSIQSYYCRSLLLEPRGPSSQKSSPTESAHPSISANTIKGNFDFLAWTHHGKDKALAAST